MLALLTLQLLTIFLIPADTNEAGLPFYLSLIVTVLCGGTCVRAFRSILVALACSVGCCGACLISVGSRALLLFQVQFEFSWQKHFKYAMLTHDLLSRLRVFVFLG
jgi:hypothetical protein